MARVTGAQLRAWRQRAGWDVPETARQLRRAAGDDPHLPDHDTLVRAIRRRERDNSSVTERYILLYARALGITSGQLTIQEPGLDEIAALPGADQGSTEDVIDVLGRIQKLNKAINPDIICQLHDDLWQTVAQYEKLYHSTLAPALLKQRAWIDAILDEYSHPKQRQQLFEIAGATSGVLGYVAVGRGEFPLARAYCLEAFQLGDFAQDTSLQAWARGLQSFCEYYAGHYDEALHLAKDGLNYAQSGPQSVRLTINGVARAMGKLGDIEGVHRAVGEAYDLMSRNDVPAGVPSSTSAMSGHLNLNASSYR